jgi:hypothetical protein
MLMEPWSLPLPAMEGPAKSRARWGSLEVFSDYECGNGHGFRPLADDVVGVELQPDWGTGDPYNSLGFYFNFAVENHSSETRTLEASVGGIDPKLYLPVTRLIWRRDDTGWELIPKEQLSAVGERLHFPLRLAPGARAYFCPFLWAPTSAVTARLARYAAEDAARCRLHSLGKTHLGRDIACLTIDETGIERERILLSGTPQASEFGDLACLALLDFLLGESAEARRLRERYLFDVVPQQNPDGDVLGGGMVNALGENPLFEFDRVAAGEGVSAEASAMWRWVERTRPGLLIEYHNYFQDDRPSFRTYVFTAELCTEPARRQHAERVRDALLAVSTGPPMTIRIGNERFSRSLPYQAMRAFGTVAHFYKLHSRETLARNAEQAVRVLLAAVAAYEA